jgi:hypothetical protein
MHVGVCADTAANIPVCYACLCFCMSVYQVCVNGGVMCLSLVVCMCVSAAHVWGCDVYDVHVQRACLSVSLCVSTVCVSPPPLSAFWGVGVTPHSLADLRTSHWQAVGAPCPSPPA